jgi:HSP20 family protein
MHDMLDRMMDTAFRESPFLGGIFEGRVPVDVYQTDETVVVKATTPGLKADDLQITITGDTLTIRGEISEEHKEEGVTYHLRERRMESFSRSITLPAAVNADKSKAEFEDGVLKLTLPKVEGVKPKTITIKAKK